MRLGFLSLALIAVLHTPTARAAELLAAIPLAPHGDAFDYATGHVYPLTPSSFLVPATGPDGSTFSADDVTVLVQDPGGAGQTVTPLATPYVGEYSWNARLSSTRVVLQAGGPDGNSRTADDQILLLDGLGSTNTVTPITVGPIEMEDATIPIALGPDLIAFATRGPDGSEPTADDTVAIISDLGGSNTVTHLAAPFLEGGCCIRAVRRGPESFLLASHGPDANIGTADDVLYFFHDLTTNPTRTDIPIPYLFGTAEPAILSPTVAVVQGTGPDGSDVSADDELIVITDLGGSNTVTPIPMPYIANYGGGKPVAIGSDRAVITTFGPDGNSFSADDSVALVSDVGGANAVTHIVVGFLGDYPNAQALPLDDDTVVVATFGPDASSDTPDDQLAVISDLGGSNTTIYLNIGGIADCGASRLARIGPGTVAVASGGADGDMNTGTGDDDHVILSGVGGALVLERISAGGDFSNDCGYPVVLQPLGDGRAAYLGSGPDNSLGSGGDDEVRIIQNLSDDEPLSVTKLKISSNAKGEKLKVTAGFPSDLAGQVGTEDLTVQVGTVSQLIPAGAFTVKKNSVSYKDKTQVIQSVKLSLKKGTLTVKGKGSGTGLENTDPAYVPVSVLIGNDYRATSIAGTATGNGVKFKAPK